MSDTKFTPGPWELRTDRSEYRIYVRGQNVSGVVARINTDWPHPEQQDEQRANAHLAVAAPELYEALEKLFLSYKQLADSGDAGFWKLEDCPEGKLALASLAKARGEAA